jgi:tetratricopeptide (TPR) repeat protein
LLLVAALGGGCTKEMRRNRAVARGDRLFAAEKYDQAEQIYVNALTMVSPPSPIAIRQIGLIYSLEGKPLSALSYLRRAATNEPDNVAVQVALGQAWETANQATNARDCAERALKLQPGNELALIVLCDLATNIPAAKQHIQKLQQQDQDRGSYHLALGLLDGKANNQDEADGELKKALAMEPSSSFVCVAEANLYLARGDRKGAEDSFKKAIQLAPIRSIVQMLYAGFLLQTGTHEQARQTLLALHQKAPDYLPPLVALMNLSFDEKKFDECNTNIAMVLQRDHLNLGAMMKQGAVCLARGDSKQAVADYERVALLTAKFPSAQVQYELALAYLVDGNRPNALSAINHALKADPDFVPAKLLRADVDLKSGNADEAISVLKQMEAKPQSGQALTQVKLVLAKAYLAKNLPTSAAAEYESVEQQQTNDAQLPYLRGMAWLRAKDLNRARTAFEKSFALDPAFTTALSELVDLDLAQGRFSDAQDRVAKQREKDPKSALPWLLLARIQIAQTNNPEAMTSLQKAIELEPKQSAPYIMLASIYVGEHQEKQALEKLNALLAVKDNAAAHLQIGLIHERMKEYDLAAQSYEKVLASNPNDPIALNNLAFDYSEHLNQPEKAYALAQKLMTINPDERGGYGVDTMGWILYRRGDYSHALPLLQESVEERAGVPGVLYHLGMAHYMMGEQEPARQSLQEALAKGDFDGKEDAANSLAILELDPQTATAGDRKNLEKQLVSRPGDMVALVKLAFIEERSGDFEQAAGHYAAALKQNPQDVAVMLPLARLYFARLSQPDKALELAKNARKAAPDDANVSALLGRLVLQAPNPGDRNYTYAVELLQDAARRITDQPDLLHDLAWAYFGVGNTNQAQTTMKSAADNPAPFQQREDGERFLAMLTACSKADQPETAGPVDKVLQADSHYAPALLASALIAEHQGHADAAEQLYERVLAEYPAFSQARRELALLYTRDGNDAKAYEYLEKLRSLYPGDLELTRASGLVAFRRNEYQKSSLWLAQSSQTYTNDPVLFYDLGMDYVQLGQVAKARTNLQYALKLNLPNNLATNAQHVLSVIK